MLVKTLCDIGYLLCSFVGMNKEKPIGSAEGERTELGMPELATATVDRMRRAFAKFGRTPPLYHSHQESMRNRSTGHTTIYYANNSAG